MRLTGPDSSPGEPAAVTLVDLMALVVGAAVVAALPWWNWLHPENFLGPWPKWLPYLWAARQVLGMACLALVPVVLARRARYGGLARPAEFLASCCGLPLLAEGVEIILIRAFVRIRTGIIVAGPGMRGMPVEIHKQWQQGPQWTWKYGLLAAAALAVVAFLLGRRRLPGWLLSAILMIAWIGTFHAGPELMWRCVIRPILRLAPSIVSDFSYNLIPSIIASLTSQPLRFLLFAVPALVALRDLRRPDLPRRSWLEWTGLGLAAILLPVSEAAYHVRGYFVGYSVAGIWLRDTLFRTLAMLAAIVFSIPIAKRLGPAWSRRPTPKYTDTIGENGPTVL